MLNSSASLLSVIDWQQITITRQLDTSRRDLYGQFLTPISVATLMAGMVRCHSSEITILDPGAGIGTLFAACVDTLCQRDELPKTIKVIAYEVEPLFVPYILETFQSCQRQCHTRGIEFIGILNEADFILSTVQVITGGMFDCHEIPPIDIAILNPPYQKLRTGSDPWKQLQTIGIKTTNIYTAFMLLCLRLLRTDGEMISLTPRSFCNGVYFRDFRQELINTVIIRQFHVFELRTEPFDGILQETMITSIQKGHQNQRNILISTSLNEDIFLTTRSVAPSQVIDPHDPNIFFRIMTHDSDQCLIDQMQRLPATLHDLGINVSTGRVVDFRALPYLRSLPEAETVPLLYPTHLRTGRVLWPKMNQKKPNALIKNVHTEDLILPNGWYVLVRRMTSKEESRRLVAVVYEPEQLATSWIAFENHLNYFHVNQHGLDGLVARGLAAFLNSTFVDLYIRLFNGHTQINATDLKSLRYPSYQQLVRIGKRMADESLNQQALDRILDEECFRMTQESYLNPVDSAHRIQETILILKTLGLPRQQQNERSALTLLGLLNLSGDKPWSEATNPMRGITQLMTFFRDAYGKNYAPNTRETVRRQTIHQFLEAGLIVANPDQPDRPINSGKTVYQISSSLLSALQTYGTTKWDETIQTFLAGIDLLKQRYAQEREMHRIPIQVNSALTITLSPGGQNVLVEQILREFAERFVPGARLIYVGDTDEKFAYLDAEACARLSIQFDSHGKMPDIILYDDERTWLVLIEAVTSHGPISPKRHQELRTLFASTHAGLVFVTAFLTRKDLKQFLADISWETEVWVAEAPSHLIHFDGERFLGPY